MDVDAYKKKFSWPYLFLQGAVVVGIVVAWRARMPWLVAVGAGVLAWVLWGLPRLIRRLERAFHRKALRLLSQGKAAELVALAERQVLLSWFGAAAPVDAKLGLAYCQMGRYANGAACLAAALPYAPQRDVPVLQAAYIEALFATGKVADTRSECEIMLARGVTIPQVVALGAAAAILDGDRRGAHLLLRKLDALGAARGSSPIADMARAHWEVLWGQADAALPAVSDQDPGFVRSWRHYLEGVQCQRRGDLSGALRAFVAAGESDDRDDWFAELGRRKAAALIKKHPGLARSAGTEKNAEK